MFGMIQQNAAFFTNRLLLLGALVIVAPYPSDARQEEPQRNSPMTALANTTPHRAKEGHQAASHQAMLACALCPSGQQENNDGKTYRLASLTPPQPGQAESVFQLTVTPHVIIQEEEELLPITGGCHTCTCTECTLPTCATDPSDAMAQGRQMRTAMSHELTAWLASEARDAEDVQRALAAALEMAAGKAPHAGGTAGVCCDGVTCSAKEDCCVGTNVCEDDDCCTRNECGAENVSCANEDCCETEACCDVGTCGTGIDCCSGKCCRTGEPCSGVAGNCQLTTCCPAEKGLLCANACPHQCDTEALQNAYQLMEQEVRATRQQLDKIRRDLAMMNESFRFLARHLQDEQPRSRNPLAPAQATVADVPWPSQQASYVPGNRPSPEAVARHRAYEQERDRQRIAREQQELARQRKRQLIEVEQRQIQDQIDALQDQLKKLDSEKAESRSQLPPARLPATSQQQANPPMASGFASVGQAIWSSQEMETMALTPLQPLVPVPVLAPVTPLKPNRVARVYYVGDLLSPPFANATLELMQQIKSSVAPESWSEGTMEIVSPSISLMICQPESVHDELNRYLTQLRGED